MVLPLYDHDPRDFPVPPYVTWMLIALNGTVFLIQEASVGRELFAASYGVIPAAITGAIPDPSPIPAYATLVTGMFLHQGWLHLLGNMLYLYVFGDDIEEAMGWWRFLAFYLASGICASLTYIAFNAQDATPMVGASGAISGVIAAYLMLRPCAKLWVLIFLRPVRIAAKWVIGFWVGLQFLDILTNADDGVAYSAHIGGLAAGALLFAVLRPRHVELFECIDEPEHKPAADWDGR